MLWVTRALALYLKPFSFGTRCPLSPWCGFFASPFLPSVKPLYFKWMEVEQRSLALGTDNLHLHTLCVHAYRHILRTILTMLLLQQQTTHATSRTWRAKSCHGSKWAKSKWSGIVLRETAHKANHEKRMKAYGFTTKMICKHSICLYFGKSVLVYWRDASRV